MDSLQDTLLEAASFIPRFQASSDECCGHLPFAGWLVRQVRPRVVVEVGTRSGNSYFAFCQSVNETGIASRCFGIAPWEASRLEGGEQTGATETATSTAADTATTTDTDRTDARAHNRAHYASFSRLQRLPANEAIGQFEDGSIELLHLLQFQTGNTYAATKAEFEAWLPKLAAGAVVQSLASNGPKLPPSPHWRAVRQQYVRHLEFEHAGGLGVIQLEGGDAKRQLPWLLGSAADKKQLQNYFAVLGAREYERHARRLVDKQIEQLQRKVNAQRLVIDTLNRNLVDGVRTPGAPRKTADTREVERLRKQIALLEEREHELLNSQSWRATRPLRSVANRLRALRQTANRAGITYAVNR